MSKLPTLQRLRREDMQDAPGWMDRVISIVNLFSESVYSALNANLGVENFDQQYTDMVLDTTRVPQVIAKKIKRQVKGVTLISAVIQTADGTYEAPAAALMPVWAEVSEGVKINDIIGMVAGKTYAIRLKVE